MIDTKAMSDELRQAQQARIEAEEAGNELEELLWRMQHQPSSGPRIAYTVEGVGRPLADWAN
jgi:hypothetical protein